MEFNGLMTTFRLSVAASAIVSLLSGFASQLVGLIFVKESIVVFAVIDKEEKDTLDSWEKRY